MNLRATALVLSVILLILHGCGGDDDGSPTDSGGADAPTISGVAPATVTAGTVVTVSGSDFGASGQLLVNDTAVATTSWSDDTVVFSVPTGLTGTEIRIRISSDGQESAEFTVPYTEPPTLPVITSIDPPTIIESYPYTLYGQNFGTSGVLEVNGEETPTTIWFDNLITFTAPQGLYGSQVSITVTTGGQTSAVFHAPLIEATERQLTFDGMNCSFPCWSDDGLHVYFTAQAPDGTSAFYSVPFDGGEVTLLYNGPGNDFMLDVQYYQAGAVIWVSDRDDGGNTGGDWELREGSAGFNPQRFIETFPGNNESTERSPVWSHSERLGVDCAWTRDGLAGNSTIYVRRNAIHEPLASGFSPCFNPSDGEYLALQQQASTGYDIMTVRVDGQSWPELLYHDDLMGLGLAWGNAGQIAYKKSNHIWIMDEDGTNHRRLTDGSDQEAYPRFSPSGTWVAFARLVTTEFEVFVARVPY